MPICAFHSEIGAQHAESAAHMQRPLWYGRDVAEDARYVAVLQLDIPLLWLSSTGFGLFRVEAVPILHGAIAETGPFRLRAHHTPCRLPLPQRGD
eukprot:scaffold266_cov248-Pinguiococcus_pyrenoidosus.AAC.6